MGHIDHGKTTLLDTICQTNLQTKEIGGITQKITASQIDFQNKKITFLDTPGHSDFIKMRQRGISLTDIVVLVIDAGDGIMFQTEEIIDYLHQYQIPVIVFINHKKPENTDNETNLNKIRAQLQEKGLTPLEESVEYLLENILLVADCKSNLSHPTNGVVIDHYLHSKTGSGITELLVQDGKLREKDTIFLNGKLSKVKIIYNLHGKKIAMALPSDPVQIIGLNSPTELGDRFLVINNEDTIKSLEKELTPYLEKENKISPPPVTKEKKNINLVLLADSQNGLETLTELIKKKNSSEDSFWIIHRVTGKLNDSSIDLIKLTNSLVLSFGLQLIVIERSKGNIAGCQVTNGKISRNHQIKVVRREKEIFRGGIKSLQINNEDKLEAMKGHECGIILNGFNYIDKEFVTARPHERLNKVFERLQNNYRHLAIVKSNQNILGVITLQDILNALVGKMKDEKDKLELSNSLNSSTN
ncbi:12248_t:CDS:2 [Ambispora leptoticha]|uniref:12248_t:CDS:1 n=1 Tax=Ambispora leptoticha TaxID=144679 RepID=A0A9N8VNI8_9GLOM|nr:12248_t:CDS:2 [Ambispora leptoticha]